MKKVLFLTVVLVLAFAAGGCSYNTMTAKQQNVKAKWSGIETQLQRRADLIGNLAEAAKMAGVQEQEVFGTIAEARSKLINSAKEAPTGAQGDKSPEQKEAVISANESLGSALSRLLVITENYPDLKSNQNFLKLQDEISGTENRVAVARGDYTTAAQDYNTTIKQFPAVLEAGLYGFKEEPYFKADEGTRDAPKLDSNSLRKAAPANK